MKLSLIATVSQNRVISLPHALPEALLRDQILVMGRNTYLENLPSVPALHVVITSIPIPHTMTASIPHALQYLSHIHAIYPEKHVFIIGGARTFEYFLPHCHKLYLTYIPSHVPTDSRTLYFPPFYDFELTSFADGLLEYSRIPDYIVPSTMNELRYFKLLTHAMRNGDHFGNQTRYDIQYSIPLLTTRYIRPTPCIEKALSLFDVHMLDALREQKRAFAPFLQLHVDGRDRLSGHAMLPEADLYDTYPEALLTYSVLVYIYAHHMDLKPYELIITTGITDIKTSHLSDVEEQLKRPPFLSPSLSISSPPRSVDDFSILGYFYHEKLNSF